MRIYFFCSSCKEESYFKSNFSNRFDLQMNLNSDEISVCCKKCKQLNTKHLNRLHAKTNMITIIIGVLISIITLSLWDLGFISTLSAIVPIAIWTQDQKRISDFNSHMINR